MSTTEVLPSPTLSDQFKNSKLSAVPRWKLIHFPNYFALKALYSTTLPLNKYCASCAPSSCAAKQNTLPINRQEAGNLLSHDCCEVMLLLLLKLLPNLTWFLAALRLHHLPAATLRAKCQSPRHMHLHHLAATVCSVMCAQASLK